MHFALGENADAVCNTCATGGGHQAHRRLCHWFFTQRKRAVVHGHQGGGGAQIDEGLQCFLRTGVHGAIAVRVVRADRQQSDLRLQPAANLSKAVEVCRVAGVIHAVPRTRDHIAAEQAMRVREHARAPVLCGRQRHLHIAFESRGLPPLQLGHIAKTKLLHQVAHAQRHYHLRCHAGDAMCMTNNLAQRWQVQVVHVRVCQQYGVDGRQVLQAQARSTLAAQQHQARCEDGINQDIAAGDLDQKRRVTDERNAELVGVDQLRQRMRAGKRRTMARAHDVPQLHELAQNWRLNTWFTHTYLDVAARQSDAAARAKDCIQHCMTPDETPPNLTHKSLEKNAWALVQHNPLASMWDLQGVPLKSIAKGTWTGIDEDNLFGRASQLAYSFFSAIFPALIAMASLMGLVARSSGYVYLSLLNRIGQLIPPTAFALVTQTFRQTTSASTAGKVTLGVLFALFSASVGISAIQDTLNAVYKVKETRPFWKARLQAMGLTLLVAAIIISALLTLFAGDYAAHHLQTLFRGAYTLGVVLRVVAWTLACLLMVLSFEVMYYFCPDVQNRIWRWFTPGGLIGLGGWIAGSLGLRVYLHFFNRYSVTYGSLGAVIILLLWFYLTGAMILLGGEVNSEIEHAVATLKIVTGECALPPASAVARVDLQAK